MFLRVTCPESAHLEVVELAHRRRSLAVVSCTAFADCPVGCAKTCAARLQRKHHGLPPGTVLHVRSCFEPG